MRWYIKSACKEVRVEDFNFRSCLTVVGHFIYLVSKKMDIWSLNTKNNKWTVIRRAHQFIIAVGRAPPLNRQFHVFSCKKFLYILVDCNSYRVSGVNRSQLYRYYIPTNTWENLAIRSGISFTYGDTVCVILEKVIIYGSGVAVLDLYTLQWKNAIIEGDNPERRRDHSACVRGNEMHVLGGVGPSSTDVYTFFPFISKWMKTTSFVQQRRIKHTAIAYREDIYVIGGNIVEDNVCTPAYNMVKINILGKTMTTYDLMKNQPKPPLENIGSVRVGCRWYIFGCICQTLGNHYHFLNFKKVQEENLPNLDSTKK
ncbi:hypothetical protein CHUAL_000722 [Chamberlinius hualienensis]